ncbi:MAG: HDOD domain-containing protein, partial [Vicinamibacterales bacterium]
MSTPVTPRAGTAAGAARPPAGPAQPPAGGAPAPAGERDAARDERPLLDQVLEFAAEKRITLPVFSDVARQVQRATRADSYDISEIERAIESDPALVAEVLRAANTDVFDRLT